MIFCSSEKSYFLKISIHHPTLALNPPFLVLQPPPKTAENFGNYVIMPIYPYDPIEEVLSERDELYIDSNNNNKCDLDFCSNIYNNWSYKVWMILPIFFIYIKI